MENYWQHVSGKRISPKYDHGEPLLEHADQYYEDYCVRHHAPNPLLVTVGVRVCEPDYRLINHYQPRHVLHWIIAGSGWCNGIPFEAGSVIYFKNHISYNFSSNPDDPCTYAWITFDSGLMDTYVHQIGLISKLHVFRTQNLKQIYELLYDLIYVSHEDVDVNLRFESALFQLLALSVPTKKSHDNKMPTVSDPRLQTALHYISKHYNDQDFRVHQVADRIGISEKYFRKLFKKEFGVGVLEYVIKLRMDAAVALLRTSNYNVAEIAEMIGYADYRQFSEIFKARLGCSPRQFKSPKEKEEDLRR